MKKPVLDPKPLRAALAAADKAKQDIVEFEKTIVEWRQQHERLIEMCDPRNPDHIRDAAHSSERLVVSDNYLRRSYRELGPIMNAMASAVRAFDHDFMAAARAEYEALLDKLEPIVQPYCPTTARAMAARFEVFSLIPGMPQTLADFDEVPDNLVWEEMPTVEELTRQQEVRAARIATGDLGGRLATAARATSRALGGSTVLQDKPSQGVDIQIDPAFKDRILRSQASYERVVRARAQALLARYELWKAQGGQFVPADYGKPAVVAAA